MNHGELDGKARSPRSSIDGGKRLSIDEHRARRSIDLSSKKTTIGKLYATDVNVAHAIEMRASPASSERARRQTTRGPTRTTARTTPHSTPPVALERPIRDERRDDSRPIGALHRRRTFISCTIRSSTKKKPSPAPARACTPRNAVRPHFSSSRLVYNFVRASPTTSPWVRRFRWTAFVPAGASPPSSASSRARPGAYSGTSSPSRPSSDRRSRPSDSPAATRALRELQPTVSRAVRVRVRLETPADVRRTPHPRVTRCVGKRSRVGEAPARGLDIATRTPSPIPRGGRCPNEPRGRRTTRGVRTTPRARRARRGRRRTLGRSTRLQTFRSDARVPVHRRSPHSRARAGKRCTRGRVETTKHPVPGNVPASARGTVVRVPRKCPRSVPVPVPVPFPVHPSAVHPVPVPAAEVSAGPGTPSAPYPARWGRRPAGVRAGVPANTVLCDRKHAASPQCTHASQRGLARHISQQRPGASTRLDGSAPHPPGTTSPARSRWASPRQNVVASTGRDLGEGGGGGGVPRRRVARPPRRSTKRRETRARDAVDGFVVVPALDCLREAPRIARVHIAARQRHRDMSPPRAGADARAACDVRHRLLRVGTREFKRVAEEISRVGTPS